MHGINRCECLFHDCGLTQFAFEISCRDAAAFNGIERGVVRIKPVQARNDFPTGHIQRVLRYLLCNTRITNPPEVNVTLCEGKMAMAGLLLLVLIILN